MKKFLSIVNKTSLTRILFIEIAAGLILNVAFLLLFIFLTQDVLEKEVLFYDQAISSVIYSFRTPLLTTVMSTITNLTDIPAGIILSLLVVLLLIRKHKKEALIFSLSPMIGGILNYILKIIFHLPRPNISPLEALNDFTYPSGHAMNNLVLYGLLAFYTFHFTKNKPLSILSMFVAVIWIGLIGFSRIYLGVHYFSDVMAGYFVGFWWLITVLLVDKTISLSKEVKRLHE